MLPDLLLSVRPRTSTSRDARHQATMSEKMAAISSAKDPAPGLPCRRRTLIMVGALLGFPGRRVQVFVEHLRALTSVPHNSSDIAVIPILRISD